MEMWTTKLKRYEQYTVTLLTLTIGILHGITYVLKTDKCEKCGNFVDSEVVKWFHISNYAMWFLLFYAVQINGGVRKLKIVFFLGSVVSEYLFCNELFGIPKDWSVYVIVGFFLVLLLALYKFNNHIFKKKKYI